MSDKEHLLTLIISKHSHTMGAHIRKVKSICGYDFKQAEGLVNTLYKKGKALLLVKEGRYIIVKEDKYKNIFSKKVFI